MKTLFLPIIPKPVDGTRTVFQHKNLHTVLIKGENEYNLVCGECRTLLATKIGLEQIQNIVLRCYNCDSYNELPQNWKFYVVKVEEKTNWPILIVVLILFFITQFNTEIVNKYGNSGRWAVIGIGTILIILSASIKKNIDHYELK